VQWKRIWCGLLARPTANEGSESELSTPSFADMCGRMDSSAQQELRIPGCAALGTGTGRPHTLAAAMRPGSRDRTRGPERTGRRLAAAVRQRSPSTSAVAQTPTASVCRCVSGAVGTRLPVKSIPRIRPSTAGGTRCADPASCWHPVLATHRRARPVSRIGSGGAGCARARGSGRVATSINHNEESQ